MRIDINLLPPGGRRYGSPPTSKVTCLRCAVYPNHVCRCHWTHQRWDLEEPMNETRAFHGLPRVDHGQGPEGS